MVDEALYYFRANVLFRSFEVNGDADRVLAYLTLFISQVREHGLAPAAPPPARPPPSPRSACRR